MLCLQFVPYRVRFIPTPVGKCGPVPVCDGGVPVHPHAGGDGPHHHKGISFRGTFSPRGWGWTAGTQNVHRPPDVFPTRVGMDRTSPTASGGGNCFPHASGDGPATWTPAATPSWFSPRGWGWTEREPRREAGAGVFPTRVGMDLDSLKPPAPLPRFPHAGGDGPVRNKPAPGKPLFSPRGWGWTAGCAGGGNSKTVFPTRVGMDRRWLAKTGTA